MATESNRSPVRTLSQWEIDARIRKRLSEAVDILNGDRDRAVTVLALASWDPTRVGEFVSDPRISSVQHQRGLCTVCLDEEPCEIFSVRCGCGMCGPCWSDYLRFHVSAEGLCNIKCTCSESLIPWSLWERGCVARGQPPTEVLRESFLKACFCKNCPLPDCSGAARLMPSAKDDGSSGHSVTCPDCLSVWCFECHTLDHTPLACSVVPIWLKCANYVQCWREDQLSAARNFADQEAAAAAAAAAVHVEILQSSFAPCPSCGITIQKDAGCAHMHCGRCGHDFCWTCFEAWPHPNGTSCQPSAQVLLGRTRRLVQLGFSEFPDVQSLANLLERDANKPPVEQDLARLRIMMPGLNVEDLNDLIRTVQNWARLMFVSVAPSLDKALVNAVRSTHSFLAWGQVRLYFGCPSDSVFDHAAARLEELVANAGQGLTTDGLRAISKYQADFANDGLRVRDEEHLCVVQSGELYGAGIPCAFCTLSISEGNAPFHRRLCLNGLALQEWSCRSCTMLNERRTVACSECQLARWVDVCPLCGWVGEEGNLLAEHEGNCPVVVSPASSPARNKRPDVAATKTLRVASLAERLGECCQQADDKRLSAWVQELSVSGITTVEDIEFLDHESFLQLTDILSDLVLISTLRKLRGSKKTRHE